MGNFNTTNNTTTDNNIIVKDLITKYKLELLGINNLLIIHIESLKLSIKRHTDEETIKTNQDMSEMKIKMIDRVLVQLDNILFQLAVGIECQELVDLLIDTNTTVSSSASVVYVNKLNELVEVIDDIINNSLLNDDRKT